MKKEYEELYGQMKAPAQWKESIKEQMHAALEEEKLLEEKQSDVKEENVTVEVKPYTKKLRYFYAIGGVAAAAAVVFLAINSGTFSTKQKESEDLVDGTVYQFADGDELVTGADFTVDEPEDENISVGDGEITLSRRAGMHLPDNLVGNMERREYEGVPVICSYKENEDETYYQAIFAVKDTTYTVSSQTVSKDEFEAYLTELIQTVK